MLIFLFLNGLIALIGKDIFSDGIDKSFSVTFLLSLSGFLVVVIVVMTFYLIKVIAQNKKSRHLEAQLEEKVKERTEQLNFLNKQLRSKSVLITDLYNNAPVGYYSLDEAGNILSVNDTCLNLLGFNRDEILNKNITSVFIPEGKEVNFSKRFKKLIESGKIENIESELKQKDGSILPVLLNASAVYDQHGKFLMSRTIFFNNRELQVAKAEKEKMMEALKLSNKELESFSYSISHDLRAPLRSIHGFANILKREYYEQFDDEGKKYFDIILQNTTQMGVLIEKLLEFSKWGKKGLNRTTFNMGDLISEVVKEVVESNFKKSRVDIDIKEMPAVVGDRGLLKQVWSNLISNAIKFSSKKESPKIKIDCHKNEGDFMFRIKDNGDGFDEKYAGKLFGVFQRLHTSTEFSGTGVGLAIVQRIVLAHGGKVGGSSKTGEGATFYFTLPFEPGRITS